MTLPINCRDAPGWTQANTDSPHPIVVSSRVRLARNLSDFPFPEGSGDEISKSVLETVRSKIESTDAFAEWPFLPVSDLDSTENEFLQERRLISDVLSDKPNGALALRPDETQGIMINEEDHLRIQSIVYGFKLKQAFENTSFIEQKLREELSFAYHDKWGYLTACPTNVGTGVRASVLLHLPGLIMGEEIDRVMKAISNLGLTVRGFYGEGSEPQGFYLQLSNQVTLGQSTESIIENLERVTNRIIRKETEARDNLMNTSKTHVEDRVWRSFGTLRYARKIGSRQALQLLSFVRFGLGLKMMDKLKLSGIDKTMIQIQPAHLNLYVGEQLSSDDRDIYRANLIRKWIENSLAEHEGHPENSTES